VSDLGAALNEFLDAVEPLEGEGLVGEGEAEVDAFTGAAGALAGGAVGE
jgi:hypothetical protein